MMSIQTLSTVTPAASTQSPIEPSEPATASAPRASASVGSGVQTDAGIAAPAQAIELAPGMDQIQEALAEVQQTLAPVARNLLFSLDEDSGKTIVKVVDSSTEEVIRQIPSEEIVAISKALDKLQGLLLKQQA